MTDCRLAKTCGYNCETSPPSRHLRTRLGIANRLFGVGIDFLDELDEHSNKAKMLHGLEQIESASCSPCSYRSSRLTLVPKPLAKVHVGGLGCKGHEIAFHP